MDPHSLLRCPAVRANEAEQNKATNRFPKVASRFSAQKVSLDLQNLTLLGWDLEALLSKGGILLLIPFLQWDLDLGRIKYIILKVFPWRQDPTPRSPEWGQKLFAKILRGERGISRHSNFSKNRE